MQTITDFWKVYGGAAFALLAATAVFVLYVRMTLVKHEGRMQALESKVADQGRCLDTLKSREADEKLREYKAEESQKMLQELKKAVSEGFARIDGKLEAQALQNVQIIGDLGNLKKSNDKVWEVVDRHEKALIALGAEVDEP